MFDLAALEAETIQCHKCPLCETRTQVVFGSGNPHAKVLLIGEAPGKNEDIQGKPFVGAAGKLLDQALEHAQLSREDIYIANVLKCRPPSNRNPQASEIEACADYLRNQTRAISPDILVTMGNFATQFILKTGTGITRLRGTVQHAGRFTVLPVYHPAAALYDPTKQSVLFQDFEQVGRLAHSGA